MPDAKSRWPLATVIAKLSEQHGRPAASQALGPFAAVLWENVAYLADDEKRAAAFARLKKATGLDPRRILATSPSVLEKCVAAPGRFAGLQAEKLRASAEIAVTEFDGDVDSVLDLPVQRALRALRKFPAIGEPGAEKILMLAGKTPTLALESNGLRVLVRLGFGKEESDYRRTYKSVQAALAPELPERPADHAAAHQVLRTHGQTLCTRTSPECPACSLQPRCPAGKKA
jgi:endonuclease III